MTAARTALMKSAHRSYRSLNRRERSDDRPFSRCLRLAHHEISGKREAFVVSQIEEEMQQLLKETEFRLADRRVDDGRGGPDRRSTPPDNLGSLLL
jgi:hypothetical protein